MINKITVTRVHGCTVHSEPSVMVAKRVEVTREFSDGGYRRILATAAAI